MADIKPYDGEQPYIFISYAHANTPAVMQVVQELHDRGFRIWYDDGIEVGSEWQENIAEHLFAIFSHFSEPASSDSRRAPSARSSFL